MVRTSLLQLGIGFTAGMALLFNKGIPFDPLIWRLLPIHIELLLLGWTMQLAMGVAFWILPRFSTAPRHGNERLGWLAYLLLNSGLTMFVADVWLDGAWLSFVGRTLELSAVVCFSVMIWPRVKALNQSPG
jgi:hypothetical protein